MILVWVVKIMMLITFKTILLFLVTFFLKRYHIEENFSAVFKTLLPWSVTKSTSAFSENNFSCLDIAADLFKSRLNR